jgi:hypothetical protein
MTTCALLVALGVVLATASVGRADERFEADRAAVRFVAPETGGSARPRFFTVREVAFHARIEIAIEQAEVPPGEYPERHVRVAVDRLVARSMLASLLMQRGIEPRELPRYVQLSRAEIADRVGGAKALEALMERESISEVELQTFLRDQVRAIYYVDQAVTPIIATTEDQLREAHRSTLHPFRGTRFEDSRQKLRAWLIAERFRTAELEFLQGARTRVSITTIQDPEPVREAKPAAE